MCVGVCVGVCVSPFSVPIEVERGEGACEPISAVLHIFG